MSLLLKVFLGFFRGLWRLAWPWRVWVGLLIVLNGVLPLFFWDTVEARVVLIGLMLGALIQMAVFRYKGFVRLLGVGHIVVWSPMLLWLWGRSVEAGTRDGFGRWMALLILADVVSLMIDATDVIRYALGDTQPSLILEDLE